MSAKRAQEPRLRRPMSAEQRAKLSATQKTYFANDPRWPAHRQKLADKNVARRRRLFPDEIAAVVTMQKQGRTLAYIREEIGIHDRVLRRELCAHGISTAPPGGTRMTLLPNEITAIVAMRKKGRTFSYIAEEIGIHDRVLRREFRANGFSTARIRPDSRAKPGGLGDHFSSPTVYKHACMP
jgi:hypothetical protein